MYIESHFLELTFFSCVAITQVNQTVGLNSCRQKREGQSNFPIAFYITGNIFTLESTL